MAKQREVCTTDEELDHAYQKFLLRVIQEANRMGLAGHRLKTIAWREDLTTGRKYLRLSYQFTAVLYQFELPDGNIHRQAGTG